MRQKLNPSIIHAKKINVNIVNFEFTQHELLKWKLRNIQVVFRVLIKAERNAKHCFSSDFHFASCFAVRWMLEHQQEHGD
jgi:hypothetical protein